MIAFFVGVALAAQPSLLGKKGTMLSTPHETEAATSPAAARAEGFAAYYRKDYLGCANHFFDAGEAGGSRAADNFHAAACCAAKMSNERAVGRAKALLLKASAAGLRDPEALADPDLEHLDLPTMIRDRVDANRAAWLQTIDSDLLELFEADQRDRGLIATDRDGVAQRDAQRRTKVDVLLADGRTPVADDLVHAAMVFQHGTEEQHIARAHALASRAAKLDPFHELAHWLTAASLDRLAMMRGEPQRFGTQLTQHDGEWSLYTVDATVTDAERRRWSVPPLAVAQRLAESRNTR
jgi:hypothetical protein